MYTVDLKLFFRLYSEERSGYANRNNYSRVKLIKNAFSKSVKCRDGGNEIFLLLLDDLIMLELSFE